MKKCPYCKIDVEGSIIHCPLCQNELTGEPSRDVWPREKKLSKQSLIFKIQLFIALALVTVFLVTDFSIGIHGDKMWRLWGMRGIRHWSLIVLLWVAVGETFLYRLMRHRFILSRSITLIFYYVVILLMITGWYCDFWRLVISLVVPILFSVAIALTLFFAMFDHSGNALIYILSNILIGVAPSLVFLLYDGVIPLAWSVSLTISIISLLALIIFKSRAVISELSKRFNM